MMKRIKMGLLIISLAAMAAGCSGDEEVSVKPPLVRTQSAVPAGHGVETFSAQVKGRREAALSFQVGGEIASRLVDVGSRVRAGDTLMTISPRDIQQRVAQSRAQIASARAQLELAQANLHRYEELFAAAAVPEAVLDQYRTNCRGADAAYQNAVAEGNEAQNALAYTELKAPSDGVITEIVAESGQVVAAGYRVMSLMQTEEMEAEVFLPENRLELAPLGAEVRVRFWANHAEAPGVVREVSPVASQGRLYRIRVAIPSLPAGIEEGMTARVDFSGENADPGCLLPLSAIYQAGDAPQVWLVRDGRICGKHVQVTSYRGDKVEVAGLTGEDHVVVNGIHKLQEGQVVREEYEEGSS